MEQFTVEIKYIEKPPLGLTPKRIHELQRCREVMDAIERYLGNRPIPLEWIVEYNSLIRSE